MAKSEMTVQGPVQQIQQSESDALVHIVERMARDPSVDLIRLREAMGMVQGIRDKQAETEAEAAFNEGMAHVQARMGRVAADASNSSTKSRYATYAALDRVIKPLYTGAGFALSFNEDVGAVDADMVRLICYVTHTAPGSKRSHTRKYHCDMPADGKGAKGGDVMTKTHAHGSATTYGRRYLLSMIFNIAVGTDDDGNAASETAPAITALQLQELKSLIKEVDAKVENICKACHVESLAEMTQTQFEKAKAKLETMRAPL